MKLKPKSDEKKFMFNNMWCVLHLVKTLVNEKSSQ